MTATCVFTRGKKLLDKRVTRCSVILGLTMLLSFPVHAKDYTPDECPVVGNTESGIYHVPGGLNYRRMLVENKDVKQGKRRDNRKCFRTEEDAKKDGYRKSKT